FRNDVLHAESLEHRAHRTAGNDASAGRCGPEENLARAVTPEHVVMQCAAFAQWNAGQTPLCRVSRLADRLRHLARLAMAETDPTLLVANHHQRGKAEPAATLDHLGHAVDVHQLVGELAVALFAVAAAAFTISSRFMCHDLPIR